jgi:hypothetical protein
MPRGKLLNFQSECSTPQPVCQVVSATFLMSAPRGLPIDWRHVWWPTIRESIASSWAYLLAPSPVRHWLLGVLILCTALLILRIAADASELAPPQDQNRLVPVSLLPDYYSSYRSVNFIGLKWRWNYEDGDISLSAYSPHCDFQVFPDDPTAFNSHGIRFFCHSCRRYIADQGESWPSLQSVIKRLIQQKIRRGT